MLQLYRTKTLKVYEQPAVILGINLKAFVPRFDVLLVKKSLDALHELPTSLTRNDLDFLNSLASCFIDELIQSSVECWAILRDCVQIEVED